MSITVPTNIIPLLILSVAILALGLRSLARYTQVKSPLIFYYAVTAVMAGFSALFYSLPFVISQNQLWLKIAVTIADVLYYAAALMMVRIIWYLSLRQRLSFYWLFVPVFIISLVSFMADIINRQTAVFGVENNIALDPIAPLSLQLLSIVTLTYIIGGALTIKEALSVSDTRQRLRLLSIGGMIFLGGLLAEYNFLFLHGTNASDLSLFGYIVVSLLFFAGLLVLRKSRQST